MPGQALTTDRPGFFGKLPCRGDFVSRNLPRIFVDPWDCWLQKSIAFSSESLGSSWRGCFADGPTWRFALAPKNIGSNGAAGLIAPSRDRVGRFYPLTIAAMTGAPRNIETIETWLERLVPVADQARAGELDPDRLAAILTDLPLDVSARPARPEADALLLGVDTRATSSGRLPSGIETGSFWWTKGNARVAASWLRCRALPLPEKFHALYSGRWTEAGWTEAPPRAGRDS